ncbi:TonB-dependent receptor [Sphingomonas gilva]|uniref:TonB-dependent receptor n=1 Tax=Sphingomonas gilva TaxID=2305907 RepID=A0A396RRC6_9SPHN|nr:TonB-dependent receptor [Sphingomonas gilva]RHW19090.1 TonB-dependent receptor [Sphingomonas gilva]
MSIRKVLLRSASVAILAALASPALGQDAPADQAEGDEIIVTGIRGSIRESIDAKRNSDVIADVITAEDIGKFPDKNVAEALQRVPGIVVNREFGEGERVSLRGTAPNLTKTLVNGHSIATADWFILDQLDSTRSFNYLTLPSEIVGRIEVYKSPQADVEEGGVGGTINVHTRNPLDLDAFTVSASAQMVYSELADKIDPQVSGLVSWKNEAETFGILLGGIYQKREIRRDGVEVLGYSNPGGAAGTNSVPLLIGSALFTQERERYGGNIGIQLRPSDALEINITGLYSRFGADNYNQNYLAWPDRAIADGGTLTDTTIVDGTVVAGTVTSLPGSRAVVYDAIAREAFAETMAADIDLTYRFGDNSFVHLKGGWTRANGDTVDEFFFETAAPGSFSYDLRGRAPSVSFTSPDPTSPAGMLIDFARLPTVQSDDEEKYAYLDYQHGLDWGPLTALKFGLKYTDHDRGSLWMSTNGGAFLPLQCGSVACTAADFAGGPTPDDFLENVREAGTLTDYWMVDRDALERIFRAQPAANRTRFIVPGSTFQVNEKSYGGYGMAMFGGDNWDGNIGVRVIRTDQTASGNILGGPNPTDESPFGDFTPQTVETSYTDVLPSANLRFELSDEVVLRMAAGRTVARPNFAQIAPGINLNGTTLTATGGNPDLQPFRANQYDLSLEWYPDRETIIAAAIYYKDILSYVVNGSTTEVFPGQFLPGTQPASCTPTTTPGLYDCPYIVNRPVNGPGGVNKGFELQLSRPLWAGFGVQANYTYSDAEADNGDPIPGNSKHAVNLTGYFENDLLSARLSYNYRSSFFINIDRAAPLNQESTESLDGSLSVNVTENVALTAEAINLTNAKIVQYSGTPNRPRAIYDNGRQFYLGARFRF